MVGIAKGILGAWEKAVVYYARQARTMVPSSQPPDQLARQRPPPEALGTSGVVGVTLGLAASCGALLSAAAVIRVLALAAFLFAEGGEGITCVLFSINLTFALVHALISRTLSTTHPPTFLAASSLSCCYASMTAFESNKRRSKQLIDTPNSTKLGCFPKNI